MGKSNNNCEESNLSNYCCLVAHIKCIYEYNFLQLLNDGSVFKISPGSLSHSFSRPRSMS